MAYKRSAAIEQSSHSLTLATQWWFTGIDEDPESCTVFVQDRSAPVLGESHFILRFLPVSARFRPVYWRGYLFMCEYIGHRANEPERLFEIMLSVRHDQRPLHLCCDALKPHGPRRHDFALMDLQDGTSLFLQSSMPLAYGVTEPRWTGLRRCARLSLRFRVTTV